MQFPGVYVNTVQNGSLPKLNNSINLEGRQFGTGFNLSSLRHSSLFVKSLKMRYNTMGSVFKTFDPIWEELHYPIHQKLPPFSITLVNMR